jgi:hypothetical protein
LMLFLSLCPRCCIGDCCRQTEMAMMMVAVAVAVAVAVVVAVAVAVVVAVAVAVAVVVAVAVAVAVAVVVVVVLMTTTTLTKIAMTRFHQGPQQGQDGGAVGDTNANTPPSPGSEEGDVAREHLPLR